MFTFLLRSQKKEVKVWRFHFLILTRSKNETKKFGICFLVFGFYSATDEMNRTLFAIINSFGLICFHIVKYRFISEQNYNWIHPFKPRTKLRKHFLIENNACKSVLVNKNATRCHLCYCCSSNRSSLGWVKFGKFWNFQNPWYFS